MKYALGIDVGGTKTAISLLSLESGRQLRYVGAGFNLNIDNSQSAYRLTKCVNEALRRVGARIQDCEACLVGMAGGDTPENQNAAEMALQDAGLTGKITVKNDLTALLEYLREVERLEAPVILASGTGSICRALQGGKLYTSGGFGPWFGDEGSGYEIGREVLQIASQMEDGRRPKTALYPLVLRQLEVASIRGLAAQLKRAESWQALVAAAAPAAGRAAAAGDLAMQQLLQHAGEALYALLEAVLSQLGPCRPQKIFGVGTHLQKQPHLLEILQQNLYNQYHNMEIIFWEVQPDRCNAELAAAGIG